MITNKVLKKQPEHKHVQGVQSWYEPALRTLEGLLEIRKANLRKINRDESNAAVMRDELIEMLMTEHRISAWYAGEIIASLLRAERIMMFGRFIQIIEKEGEA
ncbi:hypothetical protein F4W09_14825 [Acinetobacter tandoii]|uniref:Uncharacterized protein n=1 Tax=Acinetobacter tandoii TaxID=202954 RepID=A0A5N4W7C6_9GAMM|nr:hypothetical protein [Acinetobacter tandoii]KAB1852270.1 hypothetical protein F4W09_14825 [Acinetobacter tandoii]